MTTASFAGPVVALRFEDDVLVALDLAQDQGRGREALEQWSPSGAIRVW